MNRAFEAALAARWLWTDVRCLESIGGLECEVKSAIQAAFAAVEDLACYETGRVVPRYGANVPPLLLDVPELAEHYKRTYVECLEAEREWIQELEYQQEREQHLQDLADTYACIEHDLVSGWNQDCLDDGHL